MKYLPIQLKLLRPERPLPTNLYLRIHEKYILYVRKGDDLDTRQIENLMAEKKSRIFFPEDEINALEHLIQERFEQLGAAWERSTYLSLWATILDLLDSVTHAQLGVKLLGQFVQILDHCLTNEARVALNQFTHPEDNEDVSLCHALHVGALSGAFSLFLHGNGPEALALTTAGLLHDWGVTSAHQDGVEQAIVSSQKIAKLGGTLEPLARVVAHHETPTYGEGTDLRREALHLCNSFSRGIYQEKKDPQKAAEKIFIEELGHFDGQMLKRFKEFLLAVNVIR